MENAPKECCDPRHQKITYLCKELLYSGEFFGSAPPCESNLDKFAEKRPGEELSISRQSRHHLVDR